MEALSCLACMFAGLVLLAVAALGMTGLSLVMGWRRPFVPTDVDEALKRLGFVSISLREWTGEVDGSPVLVHWRVVLRREHTSIIDSDRSQLEIMVPCSVAPRGECVSSRDGRARRERRGFDALFRTSPGVAERLTDAQKEALESLAVDGARFVDLLDASKCQGKRKGWQSDKAAFLVIHAPYGLPTEQAVMAGAREAQAIVRQMEAQ
jgi:hypothetical protein